MEFTPFCWQKFKRLAVAGNKLMTQTYNLELERIRPVHVNIYQSTNECHSMMSQEFRHKHFCSLSNMGRYIYDVQMEGGGRVLKSVMCLPILLFLNNRSIDYFCGWWGRGVKKLVIFCGRHKWMTPVLKQHLGLPAQTQSGTMS